MDSFDDKDGNGSADSGTRAAVDDPATGALPDTSRRRFSRQALAGSAVLLSLGNRAAWGQSADVAGCMSVATLNSFNPQTGMFVSAPGGRPEHNEDLAAEIHRIGDPPDFLGVDPGSDWQVCPDPGSLDGVCLVRGNCPETDR